MWFCFLYQLFNLFNKVGLPKMKSTEKPLGLSTRDDWIRMGQQLMALGDL
jgi:hypothetical protein